MQQKQQLPLLATGGGSIINRERLLVVGLGITASGRGEEQLPGELVQTWWKVSPSRLPIQHGCLTPGINCTLFPARHGFVRDIAKSYTRAIQQVAMRYVHVLANMVLHLNRCGLKWWKRTKRIIKHSSPVSYLTFEERKMVFSDSV